MKMKSVIIGSMLMTCFGSTGFAEAKNHDSSFSCKVTYVFEFQSGQPGSIDAHSKQAEHQITQYSNRWVYGVDDSNLEFSANRKDGEPGIRAWISDKKAGNAILSHVLLKSWNGEQLFLSLRTTTAPIINGRKVTQANLTCNGN